MTINRIRVPARASTVATVMCFISIASAGCNGASDSTLPVAAKVDGTVISQQAVAATQPDGDSKRLKQQLDNFVSEQVLANAAVGEKLDRDPAVLAAIEIVKRAALARIYIEKQQAKLSAPTDEEIGNFYAQHPELFTHRRIYRLQEITIVVTQEKAEAVKASLHDLKTFEARAAWLKKAGIPFNVGVSVKPTEDLPADLLPTLAQLKVEGENTVTLGTAAGFTMLQLTGVEEAPLTQAQAHDPIGRYLLNQKKGAFINEETERLRKSAKVEYFGPYSTNPTTAGK